MAARSSPCPKRTLRSRSWRSPCGPPASSRRPGNVETSEPDRAMRRREFMAGGAAAFTAALAAPADAPTLVPCINQVTTLGAGFEAECSAYHDAGFRHVELWFPKLRGLKLPPRAIAARLREAGLTPVCACAAGSLLWRGAPGP